MLACTYYSQEFCSSCRCSLRNVCVEWTCSRQELQTSILSLASKILVGCDEVLETLQQVTSSLINSSISDREARCIQISATLLWWCFICICTEALSFTYHLLYTLFFMSRLRGLEQVTKATMLGHLLPVQLTSLMHPNLQTLTLADALMPQLVQLVLYTSQVCMCDLEYTIIIQL